MQLPLSLIHIYCFTLDGGRSALHGEGGTGLSGCGCCAGAAGRAPQIAAKRRGAGFAQIAGIPLPHAILAVLRLPA